MIGFFRKKRIRKYILDVKRYILINLEGEPVIRYSISDCDIDVSSKKTENEKRYSFGEEDFSISIDDDSKSESVPIDIENDKSNSENEDAQLPSGPIRYQLKKPYNDNYNSDAIVTLMAEMHNDKDTDVWLAKLGVNMDCTFVDKLVYHINAKGMRDAQVYKAAQMDKRLFSKIMSNAEYKPSKDTVIALAFALKLTLKETEDLLARAGYTFSHSNKRDVIIEYFFREGIHNLIDINEVLFRLNQKIIGRNN